MNPIYLYELHNFKKMTARKLINETRGMRINQIKILRKRYEFISLIRNVTRNRRQRWKLWRLGEGLIKKTCVRRWNHVLEPKTLHVKLTSRRSLFSFSSRNSGGITSC